MQLELLKEDESTSMEYEQFHSISLKREKNDVINLNEKEITAHYDN